jgi:hypothetical protein
MGLGQAPNSTLDGGALLNVDWAGDATFDRDMKAGFAGVTDAVPSWARCKAGLK